MENDLVIRTTILKGTTIMLKIKKTIAAAACLGGFLLSAQEIILPENAGPGIKNAGSELREYCGKMLGGKKSAARIILKIDPGLAFEEWKIRSSGDQSVELSGGSPRGVLYAAYHYLEDCCGVRFLSGDAEYVPALKELPVTDLNLQGKPAIAVRSLGSLFAKDRGSFAAKRRINDLGWSKIAPEYGGSSGFGSPAPCHTFAYYVSYDRYKKTHPEYFSLNQAGQRIGGQFKGQLCLSNPEVRRIMHQRLREFIKRDREKARQQKTPPPVIYDITQNDNQNYCVCENCKKLAAKYGGTQSGIMLDLVNELADGIKDDYPDILLSTFAYQYTEAVPENIQARPNVRVRLCDTRGNQLMPISDPFNEYTRSRLDRWSKIARLAFWDYGDNFDYPNNLPAPSEFTYPEDYRYLQKYADSVKCEISSTAFPDAREYKFYLISRFMENPDLDLRKESQDFADLFYGKAGPLFLQYRELLRRSALDKKSFVPMYPISEGLFAYLDLETLKKAHDIFDRGRVLLADDPVKLERWNIASTALDRATLTRQIHLTQAYRRAGGKAGTFPFDFRKICQRARKVHLDYIDKYIVKQANSPYAIKNAPKTVAKIKQYYDRQEKYLDKLDQFCLIPDEFKNRPEVYVFYAQQMTCRSKSLIEQDDPAALNGRCIRIYHSEKAPVKPFAYPLRGEFFNYDTWGGGGCGPIRAGQLAEPGWQWVKLGTIKRLSSSCLLVFPSWSLGIGIADAFSRELPNQFDCYLHLKAEGKAYRKDDPSKINSLYLDAVVLVRKSNQ
ncbi:MAG: DUF4838 domain-containing protein [Lentisphaerae bacterium]|nr:DUF4838 domain-containing protein [Lentisphaerota bacterium]